MKIVRAFKSLKFELIDASIVGFSAGVSVTISERIGDCSCYFNSCNFPAANCAAGPVGDSFWICSYSFLASAVMPAA